MCGRYTIREPQDVAEVFRPDEVEADLRRPRYNIAPTQRVPILLRRDGRRILTEAHWGLVPAWAKDPSIGGRMINARRETLAEKPAFHDALRLRRCLIPADGFYEWKEAGGRKQPLYITVDGGRPFALAGLYEVWHAGRADQLCSCTIITTEPNALMATIHNRMPVILDARQVAAWLDETRSRPKELLELLTPFDAARMRVWPVSTRVNSPRFDDPECVAPVAQDGGEEGWLF